MHDASRNVGEKPKRAQPLFVPVEQAAVLAALMEIKELLQSIDKKLDRI
jgi:hypothetical protein